MTTKVEQIQKTFSVTSGKKSWTKEECQALCKATKCDLEYQEGDENRMVQFVASTETADREGDVMKMAGMDAGNFLSNPAFLYVHDYESIVIGTVVELKIEGKKLLATVIFQSVTDEAVDLCMLAKQRHVRAVSIGFSGKPGGVRTPTDQERADLQMRNYGVIYEQWELFELSLCPVGMNPEALQVRALHTKTITLLKGLKSTTIQNNEEIDMKPEEILAAIEKGLSQIMAGMDLGFSVVKSGDKVTAEHVASLHAAHAGFSKALMHVGKAMAAHPELLAPGETGGVWKDEHAKALGLAIAHGSKAVVHAKSIAAAHAPESENDGDEDDAKALKSFHASRPEIFGDTETDPLTKLNHRLTGTRS